MRRAALLALFVASGCEEPETLDQPDVAPRSKLAGLGLLPTPASVCWVTGPTVNATQTQLDDIEAVIQEWTEGETGLQFDSDTDLGTFFSHTVDGKTYLTNCTQDAWGDYDHTLRLYVDRESYPAQPTPFPDSGPTIPGCSVPEGVGVTQAYNSDGTKKVDAGGNYLPNMYLWSMFPDEIAANTDCLYTTHLRTGQARNNYLHELGHGIGFSHEHDRDDATCVPGTDPNGIRKVTAYDRDSVMHYVLTCDDGTTTPGNWGSTGLSDSDRVGAEILYPSGFGAQMHGRFVGWSGGGHLYGVSDWQNRGAVVDPAEGVLTDFWWIAAGRVVSTAPQPTTAQWALLPAGKHTLYLYVRDIWGRYHVGTSPLEILPSKADYDARVAAVPTISWM